MFDYNICNQADSELFYEQCAAIEAHIPGIEKEAFLEDVDGTLVQKYRYMGDIIVVKNDLQVDALYVTASFDLLPYFRKG